MCNKIRLSYAKLQPRSLPDILGQRFEATVGIKMMFEASDVGLNNAEVHMQALVA